MRLGAVLLQPQVIKAVGLKETEHSFLLITHCVLE